MFFLTYIPVNKHKQKNYKKLNYLVRFPLVYLIRTLGEDFLEEKKTILKTVQGKRPGLSMKASVYRHMLRCHKKRSHRKSSAHSKKKNKKIES